MPKYKRQQWGRFDLSKADVENALLAAVDTTVFPGCASIEVKTFADGTAYVRGYVADIDETPPRRPGL